MKALIKKMNGETKQELEILYSEPKITVLMRGT